MLVVQKNANKSIKVFGNSNSLPISLVISLSQTLRGLHWDKVPNDNDNEVGARGILYLLIFQQLGQLLRWSWGYNVLLAPAEKYTEEEGGTGSAARLETGAATHDPEDDPHQPLIGTAWDGAYDSDTADDERTRVGTSPDGSSTKSPKQHKSAKSSRSTSHSRKANQTTEIVPPANGNVVPRQNGHISSFPQLGGHKDDESVGGLRGSYNKFKNTLRFARARTSHFFSSNGHAAFESLPAPIQSVLNTGHRAISRFLSGLWEFMNPPLWAMLIAIVVASVPALQQLFFDDGTFIRNSVTRAISQSGGVAVPLILVVLGGKCNCPPLMVPALT